MPNARVGAVPQQFMREDRHGKNSKVRGRQPMGITMEDLKHQTAIRLAQEQARRPVIAASHKKPSRRIGFLPSNPLYNRKKSDDKVKSIGSRSNISSTEVGKASPRFLNWNRKSNQQKNATDNSRYMLSSSQEISDLHQNGGRVDCNRRADMGPSEQYQQQVNHHYYTPGRSRYGMQAQQDVTPFMKYKKPMPSKSYRHGLTVEELKEMTRSRLAAEASRNEMTSQKSGIDPVRQMAKDTHLCQVQVSPNRFDVTNRERMRTTEATLSNQSTGHYQNNRLPRNANTNRNVNHARFENGRINQAAKQQTQTYPLYPRGNRKSSQQTATHEKHQDDLLPLDDSYPNDGLDNNSFHSLNSGFGSDYIKSENSYFASTISDSHSSALDRSGTLVREKRDRSSVDVLGRSLFPGSPTLSSGEIRSNDSFHSSSDSHASSHFTAIQSPGQDSVYSGILGKDSSETLPTINLSGESHYDSEESCFVPFNFGSSTLTNSSHDSEERSNFRAYCRKPSDSTLSRNGDLPNSMAESVLSPLILPESTHNSGIFRNINASNHLCNDMHTNDALHGSFVDSASIDDCYKKPWEETDDVSISQFLDDFESRLGVSSNSGAISSSVFMSKIDPEVRKRDGTR